MSDDGCITVEKKGHLLLMGIDRREKKNSFTVKMYHELSLAYARLEEDKDLRCGVLFAHGDDFTGGLDLPQFASSFAEGKFPYPENSIDPCRLSGKTLNKPVVTAVQGLCLTVGIELMLGTEIRIAADNTKFGQIEVKRGIYPVGGATIRFVREAGWGNGMRYLLTGDMFDAAEAHRIGFIQEVVATGTQLERAMEIATTISEQAPLGVQAAMNSSRISITEGQDAAVARLLPDLIPVATSDDAREGILSFVERRKAQFQGK